MRRVDNKTFHRFPQECCFTDRAVTNSGQRTEDFIVSSQLKLQHSCVPDVAVWPGYDPRTGALRKSPVNTGQKVKVAK